ncbi:QsdR family transcriptional regulator [Microbacterium thalassium]|uniref:QsdR TetR regulatory C-terminal domain-containing protein n=1 Tax=Microbacterium thalassium TaxID=362649 RepID=A0A7X0FPF6_9MICO|nr:QsdR family transcriptional regulator [Microbacterium thalassium]MBB6391176.1 hypothetical protein [Microbacterium thalassium]GLK23713.1 hypothetical protein GCM10017607_10310 [Microbacterium thalassium]
MTTAAAPRELGEVGPVAAPSTLSERLSSGAHPDAQRAFAAAREQFLDRSRIDMGALATTLGIDRTSLFRWVGNRDQLLTEVLWSFAAPTLTHADRATAGISGGERIAAVLTRFVDDLIAAGFFREFLRSEPARALRLLTTKASPVQRRYVATVEWLIHRELGDRPLAGAIDARDLAYLLARVSESFMFSDLITGDPPSSERAGVAFRLLLRVDG